MAFLAHIERHYPSIRVLAGAPEPLLALMRAVEARPGFAAIWPDHWPPVAGALAF